MPIRIPKRLPANAVLGGENIFLMDDQRAVRQDIRPLHVAILNLMPNKVETEVQILRLLSNTPLQIHIDLLRVDDHVHKNTPKQHMDAFYHAFDEVKHKPYDGLIITGAPIAHLPFEEVNYWQRMTQIMDWARSHVQSTLYLCWATHAAFYHFYGITRQLREQKLFGVYQHNTQLEHDQLLRGFDSVFAAPHSRYGEIPLAEYQQQSDLNILASSDTAGVYLAATKDKRMVFITGHPEYDPMTLDKEYRRDLTADLNPSLPINYYPNNDTEKSPIVSWRAHGSLLYTNWLNYYVYQETPYDLTQLTGDNH